MQRLMFAAALCAAALAPATALAFDAAPYNPPEAKISASCSAWVQEYAPDEQHTIFHVAALSVAPAYAKQVGIEVTVTYSDNRQLTWIVPMQYAYESEVPLEAPRFDSDEPRSLRCSVAFGLLSEGWYVAPWLPLSEPSEFFAKHNTPVAPVP